MLKNIKVYKTNEIEFDNIVYMNVERNDVIKTINIQYIDNITKNRVPLLVQLDDMYMFDDIQEISDDNSKTKNKHLISHEIILPLVSKTISSTKSIKKFFMELDKKMINDAKQHIDIWEFPKEQIKYKALIRYIEDSDNDIYDNGVVKFKILNSKKFTTKIYNKNKELIRPEYYKEYMSGGNYIKSVVEIVSVWIKNDIFGLYIRPHQLRVSSGPMPIITPDEYCFDDKTDDSESDDEMCNSIFKPMESDDITHTDENFKVKNIEKINNEIDYDEMSSDDEILSE